MSDEKDILDDTSSNADEEGAVAGERLAEARRALQIPVIEIAKELHLDEYKVRALEENDFEVIGAPVFAKGHLRKYAQLVNVDESEVMSDYYQLERSSGGAPPLVTHRPRPPREIALGPWLLAFVILLLVGAAYWWFAVREVVPTEPANLDIRPLPQQSGEIGGETETQPEPDLTGSGDPGETDVSAEPAEAPISVAVPEESESVQAVADPGFSVSITYLGDCWSEISDASGRRLFFDLGKEGRTVNLSGEPPFNALFGNVDNVRISINGDPYEVPAASRRGRTARLTIDGS